MNNMNNMMTKLQSDTLKETVNAFIEQTAERLSEMANQSVLLTVTDVAIYTMSGDIAAESSARFGQGHIVASSTKFGYDFSGRALLIFAEQKAKQIVDATLRYQSGTHLEGKSPLLDENFKLLESDFEVIKEISNVVLNSIIGEVSHFIGTTSEFSIPDVALVNVAENEQKIYLKNSVYRLMLTTRFNFTEAELEIEGTVIVVFGMNALTKLLDRINEVLGERS